MSALNTALQYAARGWPVFPCSSRKLPLTEHGFKDASTDKRQIHDWWTRWPHALIGMPTGERTGLAVLDIDMKNGMNGLRTLAESARHRRAADHADRVHGNGRPSPAFPTA